MDGRGYQLLKSRDLRSGGHTQRVCVCVSRCEHGGLSPPVSPSHISRRRQEPVARTSGTAKRIEKAQRLLISWQNMKRGNEMRLPCAMLQARECSTEYRYRSNSHSEAKNCFTALINNQYISLLVISTINRLSNHQKWPPKLIAGETFFMNIM